MRDKTCNLRPGIGLRNPQSPMIPAPDRSGLYAFAQRYLNVLMRYAGVGIVGTSAHYLLLLGLSGLMNPVTASTIGAIVGMVLNFRLARRYVFADRSKKSLAFH